ncbi:hypothetical protein FM106_05555 [Brachybacterium faecium]|nr:hypothetical protein FM106_05555 [Brachybacterium faecium]
MRLGRDRRRVLGHARLRVREGPGKGRAGGGRNSGAGPTVRGAGADRVRPWMSSRCAPVHRARARVPAAVTVAGGAGDGI